MKATIAKENVFYTFSLKRKKEIFKDIVIGKEIEIPLNQNFASAMNKSSSYLSDGGN